MARIATTAGEVRAARAALDYVMDNLPIEPTVAYRLSKIARKLDGPHRDLERARLKLVEKHVARDEESRPIFVRTDAGGRYEMLDQLAFDQEFEELKSAEVTVDCDRVDPEWLAQRAECDECGERAIREVLGRIVYELGPFLQDSAEKSPPRKSKKQTA